MINNISIVTLKIRSQQQPVSGQPKKIDNSSGPYFPKHSVSSGSDKNPVVVKKLVGLIKILWIVSVLHVDGYFYPPKTKVTSFAKVI